MMLLASLTKWVTRASDVVGGDNLSGQGERLSHGAMHKEELCRYPRLE